MSEEKEFYNLLRHALYKKNPLYKLPTYEEAKLSWENELAIQRIKKQAEEVRKLKAQQRREEEARLHKLVLGNTRGVFDETGVISGDSPFGGWTLTYGEMIGTQPKIEKSACFKLHDGQPIAYVFANPADKAEYIRMVEENRRSQGRNNPHTVVAIAALPAQIIPLNTAEIIGRIQSEFDMFGGKPPGESYLPLYKDKTGKQPILKVSWRQPAK